MRLHKVFRRIVGPGTGKVLGSDGAAGAPPTGAPDPTTDNQLLAPFTSSSGLPINRIAVAYRGPALSVDLTAALWAYDYLSEAWYECGPPKLLVPNRITTFPATALADPVSVGTPSPPPSSGSMVVMLVVLAGAAPNGEHFFSLGPDLSFGT